LLQYSITPIDADEIFKDWGADWQISTAAIVESLIRLISANPKQDRDILHKLPLALRSRSRLSSDSAPFRKFYLENRDDELEGMVRSYFQIVSENLWTHANESSYIRKMIGIQGLFDALRILGREKTEENYRNVLKDSSNVDFFRRILSSFWKGASSCKKTRFWS